MKIIEKFEQILDKEKQLLLEGEYSKLQNMLEIKSNLLNRISQMTPELSRDALQRVMHKSQRNSDLLASAQRGIKSAIVYVNEATDGSFQSYSKEGERHPLTKAKVLHQKL